MPIASKPRQKPRKQPSAALAPTIRYVEVLGLRPVDTLELVRLVGRGLLFAAFEQLQIALGLPAQQLADIVGIPTRTLHRRREEGRFEPNESDRLVRLSRVYGSAVELFEGDEPQARHWLSSKQLGLGGMSPLSMASTEIGAREVEALIGRLEHGVFS